MGTKNQGLVIDLVRDGSADPLMRTTTFNRIISSRSVRWGPLGGLREETHGSHQHPRQDQHDPLNDQDLNVTMITIARVLLTYFITMKSLNCLPT